MAKKTEHRFIEIAQTGEGEGFSGTLLRRGDVADRGHYREQVAPDAKISIAEDAILNRHHQRHLPIAAADTEYLDIAQGDNRVTARLNKWPEHTVAQESKDMLAAGVLRGLSMEYRVNEASWDDDLRTIKDVQIVDLAMVDRPAFPDSKINRAWDGFVDEPEQPTEDWL